ncbi:excalibur calcium-binding domain-containing protein [Streptomyces sp. NPDC048350]|uniref:excalibur calcium-binding domain-containing protein n=1 Tax=Streptomyces sp. NPDC048350 TaxID=3365538 RepID=UPI0037235DB5
MTQPPPPGHGYPQQPSPYGNPPYPYPPAPVRRWWQHPALIITALVVFPPGGIALAWLSRWSQTKKIIATVLAGLWFITPFLGAPPKDQKDDAKPKAAATAKATNSPSASPTPSGPPSFVGQNLKKAKAVAYDRGYNAISHDASDDDARQWDDDNWKVCFQTLAAKKVGTMPTLDFGVVRNEWPCPARDGEPIPYPKMPKVVGQTFAKAAETLKPLALKAAEADSAYTDVPLPATVDDWTVCFQDPKAGEEIEYPKTTTAYLKVTPPGTACPKTEFAELHPDPTPPSTGDDDSDSSSSSSSGGGDSAYYKNCDAAKAAGAAPIRRGQPGYRSGLDRDGDGIACDR